MAFHRNELRLKILDPVELSQIIALLLERNLL